MHFAIVEDLISDQEHLAELIKENCLSHKEDVAISCFPDGESFLDSFRPGLYTAVFLDIILGTINGIETADRIREQDREIPLVFTTTERDFALDSYGVHALDYLVKPVEDRKVAWCMDTIREFLAAPPFIEIRESGGQGISDNHFLRLDDILYTEAFRNRLIVHTENGDLHSNQTFSEFAGQLPKTGQFFECGRGLLVNFSQVYKIRSNGEIQLKNGQSFYCSRRKQKDTQQAFTAYLFARIQKGGA